MKTELINGVKLTKESLPALKEKVLSGKHRQITMFQVRNGFPLGCGSTLYSQPYREDAVAKLEKFANLPENCGEVFVKIV